MKILFKKPTEVRPVVQAKPAVPGARLPSWAMTTPESKKQLFAEAQASRIKRVPELWLRDGESRTIRFRDPQELAVVPFYRAKLRNGKYGRWTRPERGETDLFAEAGVYMSPCAVYEVIDVSGYTTKEGKKVRNAPCFLIAGSKLYGQLDIVRRQSGGDLSAFNVSITRSGAGTSTSYVILPQTRTPMTPEMKKAERLKLKLTEYFAPPSEEEQAAAVQLIAKSQDAD